MMGQNLYGYDWTLPYVAGGVYARALSPQAAIALARTRHAEILYDDSAQAPYFHYWDGNRKEHIVWFEDAEVDTSQVQSDEGAEFAWHQLLEARLKLSAKLVIARR